ncbi:phosphomannomutase/phosphoglucomutase [Ileibacterium valens]|uniref:phosphomannomutase/phosphoglucomutase n=1 Tax=Ileibacterium valens TaxID=1862668 RepID=UPI0024BAD1AA|nr:phosphomannomutase/phosphoglucomutase [Ileibacterium valens]
MSNLRELQNGSDIRGVALNTDPNLPVNLSEKEVYDLARAFAAWLRRKLKKKDLTVAVGRDSRLSGPSLSQAVDDGLIFDGVDVLDTGLSSTPAMFMATVFDEVNADGAIMLTASHMPENRNGMKFFYKGGGLDAKDVTEIIDIAIKEDFEHLSGGSLTGYDLMKIYAEHLRNLISERIDSDSDKPLEGLHIVVDAGNGAGGFFATQILAPLGANIEGSQFLNPDGSFPNHIPNPENKEAMNSLVEAVKKNHADLGLIFDTDVDRSSAVDENGNPIGGNDLVALAALLASRAHPNLTVVTDSVTSDELKDFLEKNGIHQHRFKRGYRNVINEAKRLCDEGEDAALAIETSGHAAFADNYFLDDGAYLAAQIVVEAASQSISDLISELKHPAMTEDFRLPVSEKAFRAYGEQVIEDLKNFARESETIELVEPNYEGARIRFTTPYGKGWALIRVSLHESLLPVHLESDQPEAAAYMAKELLEFLSQYPSLDLNDLRDYIADNSNE